MQWIEVWFVGVLIADEIEASEFEEACTGRAIEFVTMEDAIIENIAIFLTCGPKAINCFLSLLSKEKCTR